MQFIFVLMSRPGLYESLQGHTHAHAENMPNGAPNLTTQREVL